MRITGNRIHFFQVGDVLLVDTPDPSLWRRLWHWIRGWPRPMKPVLYRVSARAQLTFDMDPL